jgi:multidrug efflux system membrane fusion protein
MNDMRTFQVLSLLSLSALAGGCHTPAPLPQAPQAVQTQRVGRPSALNGGAQRYSAVVEPESEVPVSFRIPGYVVSLRQTRGENGRMRDIAEGDRVGRGTALAHIRAAEYEDRVRQATSRAAAAEAVALKAKLDLDRATNLFAAQSLTKPEFDAARAQHDATDGELRAARASVSEAEIALRDTTVVAPFDGEIVKKEVEPGAFVGPGAPVFVVAKTDVVKIMIGVPDTTIRSIRLGQLVDVSVDAFADRTFKARVTRIASAADLKTRNFDVEVAIPNRDHVLKAGMIGSLQLTTGTRTPEAPALQVPLSAIVQAPGGKYGVFVVAAGEAGRTASLRMVELGPVVGTDISVRTGLELGDEVITTGAALLKDGQRVEVIQ